ncbi:MAG: acetylglutamate kinase, partial [Myxococcota bacterium]
GGPTEPVDLGFVGEVVAVDHALLTTLLAAGYLPVLACLGASAKGDVFNINADVVAQRLAVELGADALVLVSDIGGVLEDRDDPSSRIATIDKERGRALIEAGVVTDGMVAKLEEAFVAVAQGVGRVHLLGKDAMASLRGELDAPGSVGTAFVS